MGLDARTVWAAVPHPRPALLRVCACPSQVSNAAIKKDLQKLYITGARQVEVATGQAAYVIFVPFKLFRGFKAIQKTLTGELEKRFR